MSGYGPVAGAMGMVILGASLSGLPGQTQSPGLEQQLRSQYAVTRVGANGVLVHAGTVLKVLKDGIRSMPASYAAAYAVFWPNNFKSGGKVGYHWSCPKCKFNLMRPLQVGEMVYLTGLEIKDADLVFRFQSCGACGPAGSNQDDPPYTAEMSFQLGKGYLANSTLKEVQDTIGQVFEVVPPRQPSVGHPSPSSVVELKLPSTYVSAQAPADQLQLNADHSFSLQEAGQMYGGTFAINGNALEITIRDTNTKTTMAIQGRNLTDPSGQIWTLREQSAPAVSSGNALRNEDIIKMTKVGIDDATIIAKIGSSKCQFDTSTDALIQLKQSGVSADVLKAMVGAGK